MSRWFRHYAGLCRDEKLVSVAIKSRQPVERVVWIWAAILESAAEIDEDGRYSLDAAEVAYFLRADESDILAVETALQAAGRLAEGAVVRWRELRAGRWDDFRLTAEWAAVRSVVFARDGYCCTYCGASGGRLECDHIVPVARGGRHDLSNLTTACKGCNRSKRDKLLEEWLA